jgi:enoyl-CoA hydratase
MTDTETAAVTWQQEGRVLTVHLRRPPVNALGHPMIEGLHAALDALDASDAKVLVVSSALTGFFAAGADIRTMADASPAQFSLYGTELRAVLNRIAYHDRPSIAAIEGRALGGGLELAMAATLRVGGADARLGLPEVKLGLIPGAGGTQRLPLLVGRGRALDIMLSAREVPAAEAHAIGLLDRLVPAGDAEAQAQELAATLAGHSGPALTAVLRCVDDAATSPSEEGLAAEARRVTALFGDGEVTEGLRAFLDRRPPDFR